MFVNYIEIKNKRLEHSNIKNIIINKSYIFKKEFTKYILREKPQFPQKESTIIKINKTLLSIYFNNIFSFFNENRNNFELILDKNRKEFINNIKSFLDSKKMFYLIYGSTV